MSDKKTAITKAPTSESMKPSFTGRIPAVDRSAYDNKIQELDSELKSLTAKLQTMNKTISDRSGGKDDFFRQRDEVKAKLDVNQKTLNDLDAAKTKIQEAIQTKQKAGHETLNEINVMKKSLGFHSEAEVDRKIADIEYLMQTESMTLKRERELMAEISKIKQMKPQIAKIKTMSVGVASNDSVGGLRVELANAQKSIADTREEKRKLQAAYSKVMDIRKKALEGVSDLVEGRDQIYKKIKSTQDTLRKTRDEKFNKIKEFQAHIEKAKVARAERDKIEKVYKDAEFARRKIEDELLNENTLPNEDKVELAENVITYCARLLPEVSAAPEVTLSAEMKTLPGTSSVLPRKGDRVEEFFFAPTKAKKAAAASKKSESKSFTHSLPVMGLFASLKLDAPSTPAQVPVCIEALKNKIATIKAEQIRIVAERKSKRAEKEIQLAEATANAEAAKVEWMRVAPAEPESRREE